MDGMSGGSALMARLAKIGTSVAARQQLRVGFLEGKHEPDGTPTAQVAAWNEFGTDTIPPRPFFRNMIAAKGPNWGADVARILKANNFDAVQSLLAMGDKIKGQLMHSIEETNSPKLADSTILRKGGGTQKKLAKSRAYNASIGTFGPDKPLIATGTMWQSVDYEVAAPETT